MSNDKAKNWLLFFYAVPSTPVSNRMKVWRKLLKTGAIPLKGAVYILPFSPEHYELLQWLVSEVTAMQGEAALVAIEKVETIKDAEIIELFNQARKSDYLALANELEELTRKVGDIKKGGQGQSPQSLLAELTKALKAFAEIRRLDFFASATGAELHEKITSLRAEFKTLQSWEERPETATAIGPKAAASYRGRIWVTRTSPFVDRMACAWLIKRFIDPEATFDFIAENAGDSPEPTAVVFDMYGGEFTHSGDLCTFEVLLKVFGLKDKPLKELAKIVHVLDLKDGKYQAPEAAGLEGILGGIRKTAEDDHDALTQGMRVFELLYTSKNS